MLSERDLASAVVRVEPAEDHRGKRVAVVLDHHHVPVAVDAAVRQPCKLGADEVGGRSVKRAWMPRVVVAGDDQDAMAAEALWIADLQAAAADVETLVQD